MKKLRGGILFISTRDVMTEMEEVMKKEKLLVLLEAGEEEFYRHMCTMPD